MVPKSLGPCADTQQLDQAWPLHQHSDYSVAINVAGFVAFASSIFDYDGKHWRLCSTKSRTAYTV